MSLASQSPRSRSDGPFNVVVIDRVLNLNFHGIGSPSGRDFGEGEREFWATPALFEATLDAAGGRDDVTLSFDDGNSTDVTIALPALRERGLSATFFIVPSWLGIAGSLTEADVRTLTASGMTIGNHGLAHHFWTELTPTDLEHEVSEGRRRLEQLTGTSITTLAIPYGAYDEVVLEALRRHDYEHVFTSDGGIAEREAWLQPREHVRTNQTLADLERMLSETQPLGPDFGGHVAARETQPGGPTSAAT